VTKIFILANGKMARDLVEVFSISKMVQFTKETGKMIFQILKEDICIKMIVNMKETLKMERVIIKFI